MQPRDPKLRTFLPKVGLQEAPGAILPRWSQVRIELVDGLVLEQRVGEAILALHTSR